MKGPAALPIQYAESMIAFTVTRFVCPAVTLESHDRANTNPVVPTPTKAAINYMTVKHSLTITSSPVNHCEKRRPTLSCQGRKETRRTPDLDTDQYLDRIKGICAVVSIAT